jgi:hypothetical protein
MPPSDVGAFHDSVTLFPGCAETRTGAPGAVAEPAAGVAESAFEAGPVPTAFVAVTVKE